MLEQGSQIRGPPTVWPGITTKTTLNAICFFECQYLQSITKALYAQ